MAGTVSSLVGGAARALSRAPVAGQHVGQVGLKSPALTSANHLIVVGGGPSGLYGAIAAAQAGFDVTVVEAFERTATRRSVFNLAPAVADSLARLDGGGDTLIAALSPLMRHPMHDAKRGVQELQAFGGRLIVDPERPLDAEAMVRSFTGADDRPWSRVETAGLENSMRDYIEARYPQISFRYGTVVDGIEQHPDRVVAHLKAADGAGTAEQGALLVSATGGRNPLGIKRQMFPEVAHFVGGLFQPVAPGKLVRSRIYTAGHHLPASQGAGALNPSGRTWATIGMTGNGRPELPYSLIWAQIAQDARAFGEGHLRTLLQDRAQLLDLEAAMIPGAELLRGNSQLGLLMHNPAVRGRVLLAGDELLAPYVGNSTGVGHALGVNGPLLADTLRQARHAGSRLGDVLASYDARARSEAARLMEATRPDMLRDLGFSEMTWSDSLKTLR